MLPENQRALERERALREATRGPDYSRLLQSIEAEKAHARANDGSAMRLHADARAGYIKQVKNREIEPYLGGFRPAPGARRFTRGF